MYALSRKLAYIRKTHRVSLSCLHELFYGDSIDLLEDDAVTPNRLRHCPGSEMKADVFTKALPAESHWRCARDCGMVAIDPAYLKGGSKSA